MAIEVDLGFAEPLDTNESYLLTSKYFPSKIGGLPAWLSFDKLPDSEKLSCHGCHRPLTFVMQLYAPIEEDPSAFHRTLFLFACNNEGCVDPSKRIFRSQLARDNKFYPFEPPNYDDQQPGQQRDLISPEQFGLTVCQLCGCFATKKCSACHRVSYCSKEHQAHDWKYGGHKLSCKLDSVDGGSQAINNGNNGPVLEEFEVVIEPDDDAPKGDSDDEDEGDMDAFQEAVRRLKPGCQNEDVEKYAETIEDDQSFSHFRSAIAKNKEQAVRFYKYDRKAEDISPLWASDHNQMSSPPPNCPNCGAKRALEFQVMPYLINLLKDSHLDWATLIIYTCTGNCVSKDGYLEEFIWTQRFSI